MSQPRILLVAYQCGPGMGSVSQIGWEWYQRLCRDNTVTLVTHVRNRQALTEAGAPLHDSEVIFIDTEWAAGPLYRGAKRLFPKSEHSVFLVSSLDYFLFDFAAYRQLKARMRVSAATHQTWDVLHRVTPVTLAAPTWLSRLGVPTVIGPLNSGLNDPRGFGTIMREESTWLIRVRGLTQLLDAFMGSTRRAARVLIASRSTRLALGQRHQALCHTMLENGVDLDRFQASPWPEAPSRAEPLRVLFVGRLVPIKGLGMLIDAVSALIARDYPVRLEVVGDGPMRQAWQAQCEALGLGADIHFHGALGLDEVAQQMRACHVFCLPSVRESGGAVLLEAMACARPVIALNFGGPGEIVNEHVGALLKMDNPEQVTLDLAKTLAEVFKSPASWQQRGQKGRRMIEQRYSWNAKIAEAQEIYRQVSLEKELKCS